MICPCCQEIIENKKYSSHPISYEKYIVCLQAQENICEFLNFNPDISNTGFFTMDDISNETCSKCEKNLLKCSKCNIEKIYSCQNIHCNPSKINVQI